MLPTNSNNIRIVKISNLLLQIEKPQTSVVFIDTHFFVHSETQNFLFKLHEAYLRKKVLLILSDMIMGELEKWRLKNNVVEMFRNFLQIVPSFHITANQIILALCAFLRKTTTIYLPWNEVASDALVIGKDQHGLKDIANVIAKELNKLRPSPEPMADLVDAYRKVWRDIIKPFGDVLCEQTQTTLAQYEEFWYTNYFSGLPAIVLQTYLFSHVVSKRTIKINDIVDIVTFAELFPYTDVYIADKELVQRFSEISQKFGTLFSAYSSYCRLVCGLKEGIDVLTKLITSSDSAVA